MDVYGSNSVMDSDLFFVSRSIQLNLKYLHSQDNQCRTQKYDQGTQIEVSSLFEVTCVKMTLNVTRVSPGCSSRIRHRNALTERAWKDAVQGLGKFETSSEKF